jgi:hypothetical protein
MGRKSPLLLDTSDMFPHLNLRLVSGESLKIPEGMGESYGVLLFYRGHW